MSQKILLPLLGLMLIFPVSALKADPKKTKANECAVPELAKIIQPPSPPPVINPLLDLKNLFNNSHHLYAYQPNQYQGLITIFQSRLLIPNQGVVHIMGPGENFYEWLMPALARNDATIVVSEPMLFNTRYFEPIQHNQFGSKVLKRYYQRLIQEHPEIVNNFEQLHSFEAFEAFIKKRIKLFKTSQEASELYPANFTLARMPHQDTLNEIPKSLSFMQSMQTSKYTLPQRIDQSLKPQGIAWVISERLDPSNFKNFQSIELSGDFSDYSPEYFNSNFGFGAKGFIIKK